jgi:hypothetical protein
MEPVHHVRVRQGCQRGEAVDAAPVRSAQDHGAGGERGADDGQGVALQHGPGGGRAGEHRLVDNLREGAVGVERVQRGGAAAPGGQQRRPVLRTLLQPQEAELGTSTTASAAACRRRTWASNTPHPGAVAARLGSNGSRTKVKPARRSSAMATSLRYAPVAAASPRAAKRSQLVTLTPRCSAATRWAGGAAKAA